MALSLIKAVIPGPPLTPHLWKERGWSVSVLVERGNLHIKPNTNYRFLTPQADRLLHIECISSVLWFRLYVLAYNTSHGCGRAALIYVPIHIYRSINTNYFLFFWRMYRYIYYSGSPNSTIIDIVREHIHAKSTHLSCTPMRRPKGDLRGPKKTWADQRVPKGTQRDQSMEYETMVCEPFDDGLRNDGLWTLQRRFVNLLTTVCEPFNDGLWTL